jgi:hypothetical protein
MKSAYLSALLLLQQPSGCNEASKPVANVRHNLPIHRFENVSNPQSPGIALDTVTGQYCKTWEWTYKAEALNGGLDTLPTCLSIFKSAPSDEAQTSERPAQ